MRQNEKPRKVKVEYSTFWHEGIERMLLVRSVGYGKPMNVYKNSSDYVKSRNDLELWESDCYDRTVILKSTANDPTEIDDSGQIYYINGISYRLIICHDYFLLKNKKMEELLSYYRECMESRKERRRK